MVVVVVCVCACVCVQGKENDDMDGTWAVSSLPSVSSPTGTAHAGTGTPSFGVAPCGGVLNTLRQCGCQCHTTRPATTAVDPLQAATQQDVDALEAALCSQREDHALLQQQLDALKGKLQRQRARRKSDQTRYQTVVGALQSQLTQATIDVTRSAAHSSAAASCHSGTTATLPSNHSGHSGHTGSGNAVPSAHPTAGVVRVENRRGDAEDSNGVPVATLSTGRGCAIQVHPAVNADCHCAAGAGHSPPHNPVGASAGATGDDGTACRGCHHSAVGGSWRPSHTHVGVVPTSAKPPPGGVRGPVCDCAWSESTRCGPTPSQWSPLPPATVATPTSPREVYNLLHALRLLQRREVNVPATLCFGVPPSLYLRSSGRPICSSPLSPVVT